MKTAPDPTLRRSGHSLLVLAKVNVPMIGQVFTINLFCLLQLDVYIPGVRIENLRNIYSYIRQNHIRKVFIISKVSSISRSNHCHLVNNHQRSPHVRIFEINFVVEISHSILLILIVSLIRFPGQVFIRQGNPQGLASIPFILSQQINRQIRSNPI